jgi:hypothetical protein
MSTVDISYDTALRAVEVAAITLTLFNAVAAGTVIFLVIHDNYRQRKSWLKISWERRTPLYTAICILISHVMFTIREFIEIGSVNSQQSGDSVEIVSEACVAANESSWWGISFPQN